MSSIVRSAAGKASSPPAGGAVGKNSPSAVIEEGAMTAEDDASAGKGVAAGGMRRVYFDPTEEMAILRRNMRPSLCLDLERPHSGGIPDPESLCRDLPQSGSRPGAFHVGGPLRGGISVRATRLPRGGNNRPARPPRDGGDGRASSDPTGDAFPAVVVEEDSTGSAGRGAAPTGSAMVMVGTVIEGEDGPSEGGRRRCGPRSLLRWVAASAVVLAGAAVAAATAVAIDRKKREAAAAPAPSASARFRRMERAVSESGASRGGALSDPSSPQRAALAWLADADERRLDPDDVESVLQRYGLAVLYFSTAGDDWTNDDLSLTSAQMCDMYGTTCQDDADMDWASNSAFLSASHECDWFGVACYLDTRIVGSIAMVNKNLTGSIRDEIFGVLKLRYLDLGFNNLVGSIPPSIAKMGSSVKRIDLKFNRFTGSLPDVFDQLSNLEYLSVSVNAFTGTISETLNSLRHLKKLYAGYNLFNGTISLDFETLPSLEKLILSGNLLSGSIPASIGGYVNGNYLNLAQNDITGTIPEALGSLPRMKVLGLYDMDLSGTIPPSLFDNMGLEGLLLGGNNLTGTIPQTVGNPMLSLRALSLENNRLTGAIPSSIGKLQALWQFFAHSNSLTGEIPSSIGNITSLVGLELGNNSLSGPVPDSFENLVGLEYLSISRNDLSGSLNVVCGLSSPLIFADCDSEVECNCCSLCCSDEEETRCNTYISAAAFGRNHCSRNGKDELCGH